VSRRRILRAIARLGLALELAGWRLAAWAIARTVPLERRR
jgi:hypothetical protein